eukprot:6176397-Pleurochrysis_carterae.AAC.4
MAVSFATLLSQLTSSSLPKANLTRWSWATSRFAELLRQPPACLAFHVPSKCSKAEEGRKAWCARRTANP